VALATDAMAILYENANITTLIVGSGDADFIPLVHQWKRRGKHTIAMSNASQLSDELRQVVDDVVVFGEHETKRSRKPPPMTDEEVRTVILEVAQGTRLTDRETNQAMVRIDWLYEHLLERYPEIEQIFEDEKSLMNKLKNELDEFLPIDGKARTFLVGEFEELPRYSMAPDDMSDQEMLELFGELCREALPNDDSWLPAPSVLNEGKRLMEDGVGLELPRSRPTGWFRQLMEETAGVEVRTTEEGHMEIRRVPGPRRAPEPADADAADAPPPDELLPESAPEPDRPGPLSLSDVPPQPLPDSGLDTDWSDVEWEDSDTHEP
jgi:hypothetical protein